MFRRKLYQGLVLGLCWLSYAQAGTIVNHNLVFQKATSDDIKNVDFTEKIEYDFDKDGKMDRLICGNQLINDVQHLKVQVKRGSNGSLMLNWSGPAQKKRGDGAKFALTSCDVVFLKSKFPSIVVSTGYSHPVNGLRIKGQQYFIHLRSSDRKFSAKAIKINSTGQNLLSAARSVKCTQMPKAILDTGVKDGALCFFAGYDSTLPDNKNYGTVTALIKIEEGSNNSVTFKDLTSSSKLPWHGVNGTDMRYIRQIRMCNGSGKYDGLHMMEGAFLDYNKDGLPDLITVGQHASIRSHQMVKHSGYPEGFYFATNIIHDVQSGMSEFLQVESLDENDREMGSKCVYITGEVDDGNYSSCNAVPDHFRCFNGSSFTTYFPEGERFTSGMHPRVFRTNGKGSYVGKIKKLDKAGKVIGDRYMKIGGAWENKFKVSVSSTLEYTSSEIRVNGWACVPNTRWRPRIIVSSKKYSSESGYKQYYKKTTDRNSEEELSRVCQSPNSYPFRFKAVIKKSDLPSRSGTLYLRADMDTEGKKTPYVYKQVNYKY